MEYDYHASLLDDVFASEDSTTYGLNFASPLNQIKLHHVSNGQLPQDFMHTLLEGVLLKEIQLMLDDFIHVRTFFTLQLLNDRTIYFCYGGLESKNKPPKAQ